MGVGVNRDKTRIMMIIIVPIVSTIILRCVILFNLRSFFISNIYSIY